MEPFLIQHADQIRLASFVALFILFALLESLKPRRKLSLPRLFHWINNLSLSVLNSVLLKLLFPILAFGIAVFAEARQLGAFNLVQMPAWLEVLLALLLLDLAIYLQHMVFHKVPLLWRLHGVHHSDVDIDVSSGIRFHPIEIILSMLIKMAIVLLIGAPALAVLLFEIILNATSMFNHANFYLPLKIDLMVRKLIVTPDMHRVHHSIHRQETDSNYGFNLSVWDRLFGTYVAQPRDGHDTMLLGIEYFRKKQNQRLLPLLVQPFRRGSD